MARLYGIRWAFSFPRLTKFKEKKSYQGVFRFDDLNVGLAEAIEILKATPQKFGKSGLLLFEALKIVYNILQCFFLTVLELSSYYHTRIILGHSAISLTAGVIFHVKILTNVDFTFPLLKCFISFPTFWFWIFGFWMSQKTSDCLPIFPLRARKEQIISYEWLFSKSEPVNVYFGKCLCSIIF